MTEKRKNKSYSKAFKEEAVALITEQGYSVAEAAKAVSIRTNQLYRCKQEQEAIKSGSLLTADDKAELIRLRKEVKQLRMEKEILKRRVPSLRKNRSEILFHQGLSDDVFH